jgi:hypothetical protein
MIYANCFTMCILIVVNNQINKQINSLVSITKKCQTGKFKIKILWMFFILQRIVINWHV